MAGDGGRGDCEFQADPAGEGLRGDVVVRWGRGVVEESGSRVLARARPAGAHCGDAVVGVVPCSRLGPGCWVLGACPSFLVTSTPPSCRWRGLLVRLLQAGQGGEHGDRVVDEAPAGPGH